MDDALQLIERYFDHELNSEELAAFEKRLANDPSFAKAFQQEKDLMAGIEHFGNQQLRKQLDIIHAEETGQMPKAKFKEPPTVQNPNEAPKPGAKIVPMTRRYWWLAAAAVVVGLVANYLFTAKQPTPQQLYAIFAVHDFDFTEMGTNEELLSQSEKLLKEKKYAAALPVLEQYLATNPDDVYVQKAKGVALLETGKYNEAIGLFEKIGAENTIMENEAKWYLALTYLKQGRVGESKAVLQRIPENAANAKQVRKLLGYLERQ